MLEHSPNPGAFLARCRAALRDDGWLAVAVPPFKPGMAMGHISPGWNTGILMYALAAAGRHEEAFKDPSIWPFAFDPARGFEGEIADCNWPPRSGTEWRPAFRLSARS